jgi:hypothetical protein
MNDYAMNDEERRAYRLELQTWRWRHAYRSLLVRVDVALRTGLGREETIEEVENELERLDREGVQS